MSMDVLKNKIRKLRNPSALTIAPTLETLPPQYAGVAGMGEYCRRVLEALKGQLPAVKVSFSHFALLGCEGLQELKRVLDTAAKLGYYVILDWQRQEDESSAKAAAKLLLSGELWPCDAVVLSCYPGSAAVKPYIQEANAEKKDVFVVLKTAGKSGSELQDLQTGGRTVYTAGADLLAKGGDPAVARCGYSRVAAVGNASHMASLKVLREKYPRLFLLVDGYSAVGANAKHCSYAFDKFGHGAVVCGGGAIVRAWQQAQSDGTDYLQQAQSEVDRMKRNLLRYITIL